MSKSDSPEQNGHAKPMPSSQKPAPSSVMSIFTVPRPIRRLFDAFPLRTYPANELPGRAQRLQTEEGHALLIWCGEKDALEGRASFNPACLRWQVYLKTRNVKFHSVPSSNHASTSERLPLLLVNSETESPFDSSDLVSSQELAQWATKEQDSWPKDLDLQYEAYMSLLNNEVRRAWTYHMYQTANFDAFTVPSYIGTHTSTYVVRFLSGYELRNAARDELLKFSPKIDIEGIYGGAQRAFHALNNIMKRKKQLYGKLENPSLLETTLFAYLFLILEMPKDQWLNNRLPNIVSKYPALVQFCADWKRQLNLRPPGIYDSFS